MGTSDIRAGRAFVDFGVNDSKLIQGLNKAQARLRAFGNAVKSIGLGLTGIGAGILTPILGAAKQFAETGDALDKMSQRTGISVEKLSALGFAAERSGTSLEDMENSIRHMQRSLVDASDNGGQAALAIQALGLNLQTIRGLSPDQQFEAIATKLLEIKDPTLRAADAMKIFGKSGTSILPVIERMADATARQKALGGFMSKEDVQIAVALHDAYQDLKTALGGVANAVGSAVGPVLTEMIGTITQLVAKSSEWIRQNKDAAIQMLKFGIGFIVAGGAALAFAYTLQAAAATIGAVTTLITAGAALAGFAYSAAAAVMSGAIALISGAFAALGTIGTLTMSLLDGEMTISALVTSASSAVMVAALDAVIATLTILETMTGLIIPVLVGLAVVLTAAVAAMTVAITVFKTSLLRLWEGAKTVFNGISDTATEAFDGVKDALKSGDIELAFNIVTTGIKVIWYKLFDEMWSIFIDFANKIKSSSIFRTLFNYTIGQVTGFTIDENKLGKGQDKELEAAQAELDALRTTAKNKADPNWSWMPDDDFKKKNNPDNIGEAIKAHSAGLFNVGNAATAFELGAGSGNWQKDITRTADGVAALLAFQKKQSNGSGVTLV